MEAVAEEDVGDIGAATLAGRSIIGCIPKRGCFMLSPGDWVRAREGGAKVGSAVGGVLMLARFVGW